MSKVPTGGNIDMSLDPGRVSGFGRNVPSDSKTFLLRISALSSTNPSGSISMLSLTQISHKSTRSAFL